MRPLPLAHLLLWLLLSGTVGAGTPASAQSPDADSLRMPGATGSLRGVVWTPPERVRPARAVLQQMHAAGITAVRLTRPLPEAALPMADTLGLRLFVDLPAASLTPRSLRRRLPALAEAASTLARLSQTHPSLHAVGIAQNADTRRSELCDGLSQLATRIRQHSAGMRIYYVTALPPAQDACTTVPDRVLVDMRGVADPVAHWEAWQRHVPGAGVGAVGTWIDPNAARGLRVPHSPERQARLLETVLPPLLDRAPVVFVSRWSDAFGVRRYGLHADDGTPRLAFDVLRGMYTGAQTAFALATGEAPAPARAPVVLFGWVLLGSLLLLYAQRPGARRAAYRYMRAHPFYRDVLREGRDVLPDVSTALLLTALSTLGVIVHLVGQGLDQMPATTLVLEMLPPGPQSTLASWMAIPATSGILIAAIAGGAFMAWMLLLLGVAQRYGRFTPRQTLMLVAWPCWTALPGLMAALVLPSAAAPRTMLALLAGGAGLALTSTLVRILRDYAAVTQVPAPLVVLLALPSPWGLAALAATAAMLGGDVPLRLLGALLQSA